MRSLFYVGERCSTDDGTEVEVVEIIGETEARVRVVKTGEMKYAWLTLRRPPKGWGRVTGGEYYAGREERQEG